MAELDGSGNVVQQYVYGSRANVPDYIIKGSNEYQVITDQLGSVRFVVDVQSGQVMEEIDYDAWGNVTNDTNAGFQPFGFAGGIYDQDTFTLHFGARDYDSFPGRWLQKDPALFGGGETSLYGYVGNDPINHIDPTGLVTINLFSYTPGPNANNDPANQAYLDAQNIVTGDGEISVAGHGYQNGMVGSDGLPITVDQLATRIMSTDRWKAGDRKIRLFSCNTGAPSVEPGKPDLLSNLPIY